MDIPYLEENQFAVGKAELSTGIILRNDGTRFQNGEDLNRMYQIFNSCEGAKKFILEKIKDDYEIEYWIVDSKGNYLIPYDKHGMRG